MKYAIAIALLLLFGGNSASAFEGGNHDPINPADRDWFKNLKDRKGTLCCDTADGHKTQWRAGKDGGYEVFILGSWVPVPPDAIIYHSGNPTGENWVWYYYTWDSDVMTPKIRCFVEGGGI